GCFSQLSIQDSAASIPNVLHCYGVCSRVMALIFLPSLIRLYDPLHQFVDLALI
ncbi:unnamed protein product, partial [marine sediment metagenome]